MNGGTDRKLNLAQQRDAMIKSVRHREGMDFERTYVLSPEKEGKRFSTRTEKLCTDTENIKKNLGK